MQELLKSDFEVDLVVGTADFLKVNKSILGKLNINEIIPNSMSTISSFKNNNSVVAIVKIPAHTEVKISSKEYVLALDDIRDPGNLGTIIRIADWYGIDQIIASSTTTDFFNPKVISASMGSFTRVKIHQTDLKEVFKSYKGEIYGALMNGTPLHNVPFGKGGIIVMGNESTGINSELQELLSVKVTIPRYGQAESLNVGSATAVICDRIRSM